MRFVPKRGRIIPKHALLTQRRLSKQTDEILNEVKFIFEKISLKLILGKKLRDIEKKQKVKKIYFSSKFARQHTESIKSPQSKSISTSRLNFRDPKKSKRAKIRKTKNLILKKSKFPEKLA